MMRLKNYLSPLWLSFAAAIILLAPAMHLSAQSVQGSPAPAKAAPAKPATAAPSSAVPVKPGQAAPSEASPAKAADTAAQPVNRALAYYHLGLATIYEEQAISDGQPELATRAIEEYKLALNSDPDSPQLNDGLADLYYRSGRSHDAEVMARDLLKTSPNDIDAHKMLGRIYLRELGEAQNSVSSTSPAGNPLDKAIAEFEKIVVLQPKNVEDHMVLGQLYIVKHDAKKAETEFEQAKAIDPESEEVVLNLARLYVESGDMNHAAEVIEGVAVADRTPKMEVALGAAYDQLKRPEDAIAAYRRAVDLEPGDLHTMDALAQALLGDNQLDAALKEYKDLAQADPENTGALIHICEIQRRQGKYENALATARKVRQLDPGNLEAGYNEGLLLDVLGRYNDAAQTFEKMVDLTSHANGAYTTEEKNNRGIFLERLGAVYHEENKTPEAIAAYQKLIDMGGDSAIRGYQGQVDTYRDAKQFDQAVDVAHKAVEANPKDRDLKLMLAGELLDLGKTDEGLALAKGLLDNTDKDRAVWLALGQMNVRVRRWKDAGDAFARAEALTTKKEDKTMLLFLKGELAERQKHYDQAEQLFRQVLVEDPSSAITLNYLGYMLADKGARLPEALKMIHKAVELDPMNGAYLDSLGWVYFKMGQYELSENNLRQAVERDQTDPTVHDHLGDLYEKTGRIRLAAAQWELSLAEYQKSAPADVDPGDVAKVQKKLDSARIKLAKEDRADGLTKQ